MTPTAQHICQGSAHGTAWKGWGGAIYYADASAFACLLSDKDMRFPHISQRIDRRRWVTDAESWRGIDESGARFY